MKKITLFVCLFVCLLNVNAQQCGTEPPQNYETFESSPTSSPSAVNPSYCINIAFRIVRDNDGSNAALNPNLIPQILAQLNQVYNQHGISFYQIGTFDYVNNTNYNNYVSTPSTSPTNIPNCLNVYFIKNFQNLSASIGGIGSFGTNRSAIRGSMALDNFNVAHEIGHNLNLLHTFQCTQSPIQTCTENPLDTSQCLIKGDKICDTPTDYNPFVYNSSNPTPYPISNYNPDKSNIMSYWANKNSFTIGQAQRMKDAILNAPQLQSIRSNQCAKIDGLNYICSSGNYNFSTIGYGSPINYSWSVSNNLQIIGSTTTANVVIKSSNINNVGTATINVTINGTLITKTISIGAPIINLNNQLLGVYDWASVGYGNMGLIAPTNSSIESFSWTIEEDSDFINSCSQSLKPKFINSNPSTPYLYSSTTNQAVVNWGSCSCSYLITCIAVNSCGETFYQQRYVDVGLPKNNPCYKNTVHTVIAPNPIQNREINIVVNKTPQHLPCNWKENYTFQDFNHRIDLTRNEVSIYDFN